MMTTTSKTIAMTTPTAAKAIAERNAALEERDRYREILYATLIRNVARDGIAAFGGKMKALRLIVEQQLTVREADGKFFIVVLDPATRLERPGITVDDLLTEMRASADYAGAFDARPSGKGKLPRNPWRPETWNATQQAKLLIANPGLAVRLREEAGQL